MQKLYTIREAAQMLSVCPDTIRRLADRGKLKIVRVARRVLVPVGEIDRMADQGEGSGRKRRSDQEIRGHHETSQP